MNDSTRGPVKVFVNSSTIFEDDIRPDLTNIKINVDVVKVRFYENRNKDNIALKIEIKDAEDD